MITQLIAQKKHIRSTNLLNTIIENLNSYEEDILYYKAKNIKDWENEWDFKTFDSNIFSHGFHQYPAKFIPQLARKLLRIFTNEDSTVLDIFSGSGTSIIEAMLLNRKTVIGIELNPFAVFMTKVKTKPINPVFIQKEFIKIKALYYKEDFTDYKTEDFPNIKFWFKEETIKELSKLKQIILNIENKDISNFFLLPFSEVIRKVSLTNHGGFKLHRDKKKLTENFKPDVFNEFYKISIKNIRLMADFYNTTKNNKTKIQVYNSDSRLLQPINENSVDFILTSPPYGDSKTTVAYGQYSRLSWQWISNNSDILSLDNNLLGGKVNSDFENIILNKSKTLNEQISLIKEKDLRRAKDVLSFYIDLYKTIENAFHYLKKNKYFVLVTGNRTVKEVFLQTDKIISEFAEHIGFHTDKILFRNIINKRMPRKNSPTNEKGKVGNTMLKEDIIFLRKY